MRVKRILAVGTVLTCMMVSFGRADISVGWNSDDFMYVGTSDYLPDGSGASLPAYHQLLWSSSDPTAFLYDQVGDVLVGQVTSADTKGDTYTVAWGTEYVLQVGTTTDWGRFDYRGSPAIFTDAEFGLSAGTLASGFLYSRLFDDTTLNESTYYYEGPVNSSLVEYNPLDTGTTLLYNSTPGSEAAGSQYDTPLAVPEPGTMALFGFGLVAFALRRRRG